MKAQALEWATPSFDGSEDPAHLYCGSRWELLSVLGEKLGAGEFLGTGTYPEAKTDMCRVLIGNRVMLL